MHVYFSNKVFIFLHIVFWINNGILRLLITPYTRSWKQQIKKKNKENPMFWNGWFTGLKSKQHNTLTLWNQSIWLFLTWSRMVSLGQFGFNFIAPWGDSWVVSWRFNSFCSTEIDTFKTLAGIDKHDVTMRKKGAGPVCYREERVLAQEGACSLTIDPIPGST